MFRPIRRTKNKISDEDAKRLLISERRGVFSVNGDDGYPFSIPVNYFYDESAGKIYFHGARSGHKIDSIKKDDKVCFTVFGNETFIDGEWAPYMQSVVVFGRCKLIDDASITEEKVRELATKYYPSKEAIEEEIAKDIGATQLYEITIEHLCGKQVQER